MPISSEQEGEKKKKSPLLTDALNACRCYAWCRFKASACKGRVSPHTLLLPVVCDELGCDGGILFEARAAWEQGVGRHCTGWQENALRLGGGWLAQLQAAPSLGSWDTHPGCYRGCFCPGPALQGSSKGNFCPRSQPRFIQFKPQFRILGYTEKQGAGCHSPSPVR